MSGICTVDIITESHSIISSLSMFDGGVMGGNRLSKCGHQQGKYRRITMLVYIHREPWNITQDQTQKCKTVSAHLTPPPPITLPVSLTKGHVHTPTRQPRGSPVSNNPSEPPLRVMECGEVADTHHHLFSWIISVLMVYLTVQVPLKMPGSPCVWTATPSQKLICVDRTVSSGGVK